nr:hypothetical protein [Tanacetum cinerariifolium]
MKDIIDIGFSSMIGMASEEIPGKIAHFVVDNFDVDSMKLKLSNSVISITPELVYKILGVPLGGEDINRMNRLGTEDVTTLEWHGQFSNLSDFGYAIEDNNIQHESEYGNVFSQMDNSLNFNDMLGNYNVGECSHGVEELDNDFINQTNKENGEDSLEEMIEEVNQKIIEADIVLQKSINDDVQSKEY